MAQYRVKYFPLFHIYCVQCIVNLSKFLDNVNILMNKIEKLCPELKVSVHV